MPSMCYHSPSARYSSAYEPANGMKKPARGSKNLFKTALSKLTRKRKEKKATGDNVYEVIVIYKDKQDDHEDSKENGHRNIHNTSNEDAECQETHIKNNDIKEIPPKAPPRSRSRPNSRNSCKTNTFEDLEPIRPARSRSQSRSSCKHFSLDNSPPTPPPRSRPQSRNSCKNTENNKTSCQTNYMQNDMRKPPIAPPRSPLRKERKQLVEKSTATNKSVRKSVSLTDLDTRLDYIDTTLDYIDSKAVEDKSITNENLPTGPIISSTSASKLDRSADMVACNARMDNRWAMVMNSSNLSLSVPSSGVECLVKETHLGPVGSLGWRDSHMTQSYSGLAGDQLDMCGVPENNLGQLAPRERVKLSLDKLDIPTWYMARPHREDSISPITQRPAWKKGSFADIQKTQSKSSPCSPLPPSSPPSSHSKRRNNLTDSSFPPTSPIKTRPQQSSDQEKPYTGWRSQEKLPTFLPTDRPHRIGKEMLK